MDSPTFSSPSLPSTPSLPSSPLSLHSFPDSALSLSPHTSASHLVLPPPLFHASSSVEESLHTSRTLVLPEISFPWPQQQHSQEQSEEREPTVHGPLEILLVSRASSKQERSRVRHAILSDNPDVLHVFPSSSSASHDDEEEEEEEDGEGTIRAETLPGAHDLSLTSRIYDPYGPEDEAVRHVLSTIYARFRRLSPLLSRAQAGSGDMRRVVAGGGAGSGILFGVCVFVLPTDPTPVESTLYRVLSHTLPVLPLSSHPSQTHDALGLPSPNALPPFASAGAAPLTTPQLVHTLFHDPAQRAQMMHEAGEAFEGWWAASPPSPPPEREIQAEGEKTLPMPILDPLHPSALLLPALALLPPLLRLGLSSLRARFLPVQLTDYEKGEYVPARTADYEKGGRAWSEGGGGAGGGGGGGWGKWWVVSVAAMTALCAGLVWVVV